MSLIFRLFSLVPGPAKLYVVMALAVVALGTVSVFVYKIDRGGFNRCENRHSAASAKLKEEARKEIIKTEKKFDKIKDEVGKISGNDDGAGPRVTLAIDGMYDNTGR